ncbi:hypothetical protein LCGC14_1691890 [marine sediment metagenome]|uniref:Uncharacterized protein n=1 Tax=marine sediment metagenome TaxID=412755 RepID=A0A0F9K125_9ZZZZ
MTEEENKLNEKQLKKSAEIFVRDMLENILKQNPSEETIQYTSDRVFHAIYPAIVTQKFHE